MKTRLWIAILATVVVTAVVGCDSVEAQVCAPGAFCDRDRDGFIKDHRRCSSCDGEIDCNDDDPDAENLCDDGGGSETVRMYSVTLGGSMTGGNASGGGSIGEDWEEKSNGQVSRNVSPSGDLNIGYFVSEWTGGPNCFPDTGVVLDWAILRDRKGGAETQLWFAACADTDDNCSIEIGYLLKLFGSLEANESWPPSGQVGDSHVMTMTAWEMRVGGNVRNISCTGEGTFPAATPTTITVTRTQ